MKKFFSMLAFAVIVFTATAVTHAAPNITVEFTGVEFDSPNKTITLVTRLTNSGDQDAEVDALKLAQLKLSNADTGEVLFEGENVALTAEPFLVKAGGFVENVVGFCRPITCPLTTATRQSIGAAKSFTLSAEKICAPALKAGGTVVATYRCQCSDVIAANLKFPVDSRRDFLLT